MDAIRARGWPIGHVLNKAVCLAIGITRVGVKEILGMWVAEPEGAGFWLQFVTELRQGGVQVILIASADALKGLPEAVETVFPQERVQLCIVQLVRNSLKYVSWKQCEEVTGHLKTIYQAPTAEQAEMCFRGFEEKWDKTHPSISESWRRNWERMIVVFAYQPEICKVVCTTIK